MVAGIENRGIGIGSAHFFYNETYGPPWWKTSKRDGGVALPALFSLSAVTDRNSPYFSPELTAPLTVEKLYALGVDENGEEAMIESKVRSVHRHRPNGSTHEVGVTNVEWEDDIFPHYIEDLRSVLRSLGKEDTDILDTIGLLFGGKMLFAGLYLGTEYKIKGEDTIVSRLSFLTGANRARSVAITPTRPVCWNTVSAGISEAERNGQILWVRHTKNSQSILETAAQELAIVEKATEEFAEVARLMANKTLTVKEAEAFVKEIFPHRGRPEAPEPSVPTGNDVEDFRANLVYQQKVEAYQAAMLVYNEKISGQAQDVLDLLETQPGADLAGNTLWNAFNGVTYYLDHQRKLRGDAGGTLDARIDSNMSKGGANYKVKELALATAQKFLV